MKQMVYRQRNGVQAFGCKTCHTEKLTEQKVCDVCDKIGTIIRTPFANGKDERCLDCLNAYIDMLKFRGIDHTNRRLGMRYNFACPFCMVATDWVNLGYVSRCVICKADGTNTMQICHLCEQINFIYTNRGEFCVDCVSDGQYTDHNYDEEVYKTCPFFCQSVQLFTPFKRAGEKIGDRCSKCTVLTIEKPELCCNCRRQTDVIYWYKGKNQCMACFNVHKEWFQSIANRAGGHIA